MESAESISSPRERVLVGGNEETDWWWGPGEPVLLGVGFNILWEKIKKWKFLKGAATGGECAIGYR